MKIPLKNALNSVLQYTVFVTKLKKYTSEKKWKFSQERKSFYIVSEFFHTILLKMKQF